MKNGKVRQIAAAAAGAVFIGGAGGALTEIGPWYFALEKPGWKPPDVAFGPIWTTILTLSAAAAVIAWRADETSGGHRRLVILAAANGLFNILWSLLFFKLQRPDLALAEVGLLWLSILAPMLAFRRKAPVASLLLAPYLIWVSIASLLNYQIVAMNGPFG